MSNYSNPIILFLHKNAHAGILMRACTVISLFIKPISIWKGSDKIQFILTSHESAPCNYVKLGNKVITLVELNVLNVALSFYFLARLFDKNK
jgi:hypothetical protein